MSLCRKLVYRKLARSIPDGLDKDDAVQEAYLLAKKAKERYDAEKPDVDETLWIWMRTMGDLRDKFDVLRRQSRAFHGAPGSRPAPPVDPIAAAIARGDLRAALDKLNADQREVVEAIFFGGETQDEVAKRRGVSQPAVSKMLTRAFAILREHLGDDYMEDRG